MNCPITVAALYNHPDTELRELCVRSSLLAYVNKTRFLRAASGSNQLFLAYGKYKHGQPITVQRVSFWLKDLINDCYARMGLPHQVWYGVMKFARGNFLG